MHHVQAIKVRTRRMVGVRVKLVPTVRFAVPPCGRRSSFQRVRRTILTGGQPGLGWVGFLFVYIFKL